MTAAVLISACHAAGVNLVPNGELILLQPPGKLPVDLRAKIKAAKPEVLRLLRARAGLCSACGQPVTAPPGTIPFARRTQAGDLLHGRCWLMSYAAEPVPALARQDGPDDQPRGAA